MLPLEGLGVLLVDDDPDSLEIVRVMLEGQGAAVTCVNAAREALALVQAEHPDVILCDIAMPDHDGYWLLRQVRALPVEHGRDTPVAALTAHASAATRDQVLAAGFGLHITKPADPKQLVKAVRNLAGRREE
jgi:CheY-like chemotaxis protein